MSRRRLFLYYTVLYYSSGTESFILSTTSRKADVTLGLDLSLTSENVIDHVKQEHDRELELGFDTFGVLGEENYHSDPDHTWSDDNFISYELPEGSAGPDEYKLLRGNCIFMTKNQIFSSNECNALIQEAKEIISEGLIAEEKKKENTGTEKKENSRYISNSELGEARVSTLPEGKKWLQKNMREKLLPLIESRFGVNAYDLTLNDALIIGYIGPSGSQPLHRDASILSLNIALSPLSSYEGGGTHFEALTNEENQVLKIDQGHVLCHNSGAIHCGVNTEKGERWIMVLFLISKNQEHKQISRYCHRNGIQAMDSGNLIDARRYFETGLEECPNDFLLHNSLAKVKDLLGDGDASHTHLSRAAESYIFCQKALITQGKKLLSERKPRAALRRFEEALIRINDRDIKDENALMSLRALAWEARLLASQCSIMCSEWERYKYADETSKNRRVFTSEKLPAALKWINTCLQASPGDPRLLSLLSTSQNLLNDIEQ